MSENLSLGQSISKAIKFLTNVYEDIGRLIHSIDEAMEKRGWIPMHNRVTGGLSDHLHPERWLMQIIYRCYAPDTHTNPVKKTKKTRRMVTVVVNLSPPAGQEAICLLTAVRFPNPKAYSEIWDGWDSGNHEPCGSDRLTEFLVDQEGAKSIPEELLRSDLFPGAEKGVAFAVPLCTLVDAQTVQTKIVSPLLQEASKLSKAKE